MRKYVEYIRENDVTLTHSLINLQRSRNVSGMFKLEEGTALEVMRETDAGIVVTRRAHPGDAGAAGRRDRGLFAAPGPPQRRPQPVRDEFLDPVRHAGPQIPVPRQLRPRAARISTIRLGSRFEEMDCVVFFDDVLVPWERVFLLYDVDRLNATPTRHPFDGPFGASGRREEPRQMRVRARPRAADDADPRQRAPAAYRGAHRRVDAVHRIDALVHARRRGRCRDRPLGRHVPGDPAGREHPQPDDDLPIRG